MPTPSSSAAFQGDLRLEIAHLLLIDIVGYTKLLVNEQIDAVQQLNGIVRNTECFRAADAERKLIRVPTGDGMALLFFHSPEEPVRCALEIAKQLKEHPEIQVRMGIHSGPVNHFRDVNDTLNVVGAGINVAQRVMDCGDAGHILLSKHVAGDLVQYRQWQPYLRDLGEYEVKHGLRLALFNLCKDGFGNPDLPQQLQRRRKWRSTKAAAVKPVKNPVVSKPVLATALIVSIGALAVALFLYFRSGWHGRSGTESLLSEKSIAVLPFENRSEEKANDYFAEGIQDEILTRLAKISDLKVISRTSTQQYKASPENLREIAKQLGVANVVEGSVQKSGDAVRVNVQLIKAATDTHLWADTYDRKLTDIFSVESDIAKTIAEQLRARLTGQEQKAITSIPTENPAAYDAYLRGLAYNLRTANSSANSLGAQKYLKQAVTLDPKFALSWALLSYVDSRGYVSLRLQPTAALKEEARQAAETALTLQPNLGEALLAKGNYYYGCLKQYDEAIRYFEKAREVLPNSSRIPELLSYVTRRRGEWSRSEKYFNEAERLDPRNVSLLTQHAASHTCLRDFSAASAKLDQILDIAPDDADTLVAKAAIAQGEGDLPRASAILGRVHPGSDDSRALETQAYQAILERRPAPIISRLNEVLTNPDPALGYINGELRFWLAWAQEIANDQTGAQENWRKARDELEGYLRDQPDNYILIGDLALINAGLKDRITAERLVARAAGIIPIEKDAVEGPQAIEIMARVAARFGDAGHAIPALEKLVGIPYEGVLGSNVPLTPALLRLDPMFNSIRSDPRFEKIASGHGPSDSKH